MAAHVSIPYQMLVDKDIGNAELRLYALIAYNVGQNGYMWWAPESIMQKANISKQTFYRLIKKLEDKGYIVRFMRVKRNHIYQRDYEYVIWLKEFYDRTQLQNAPLPYHHWKKKIIKKYAGFENPIMTSSNGDKFYLLANGLLANELKELLSIERAGELWNHSYASYVKTFKEAQNDKGE